MLAIQGLLDFVTAKIICPCTLHIFLETKTVQQKFPLQMLRIRICLKFLVFLYLLCFCYYMMSLSNCYVDVIHMYYDLSMILIELL